VLPSASRQSFSEDGSVVWAPKNPLLRPALDANTVHHNLLCCGLLQSFSEDGSVVWESKDILLALEERFPHASPLLPTDEEEKQKVSSNPNSSNTNSSRNSMHWSACNK
jgi:hypothetical protein